MCLNAADTDISIWQIVFIQASYLGQLPFDGYLGINSFELQELTLII